MKSLSLKLVSAVVVTGTLLSYAANANSLNDKTLAKEKANQLNSIDFTKLTNDFDKNKDGQLSKAELSAGKGLVSAEKLTKAFEMIDADGDKSISSAEFSEFVAETKKKLISKAK